MVAEAADQLASDEISVVLVHAARREALVGCLDYNADAVWLKRVMDRIGNLRSHSLLNLQALGIYLNHSC